VKLTRVHEDDIPYIPLETIVIKCPQCFGTGRELSNKERLEFVREGKENLKFR
jgi:hypothetical protein